MCEIKITISAPELANAITALAKALSENSITIGLSSASINCGDAGSIDGFPLHEEPVDAPAEPEKQVVGQVVEPTVEAPVQAPEQPAARKYTITELSQAGADLCTQGKMSQLIELLKGFGVQALTQVPESKYDELVAGLISLGAKL